MPSLADLIRMGKQYIGDAMPGGALNQEVTGQSVLDGVATAASPVPILGDVLGLVADLNRYKNEPESRTAGNFAMSGLGLLPFVPSMVPMVGTLRGTGFPTNTLNDLISSQRFIDRDIVAKKIREKDFTVKVTPPFEVDGEMVRAINDGHHALDAARRSRNQPNIIEQTASENDRIGLLNSGKIQDYLDAAYHDSPWYRVSDGSELF